MEISETHAYSIESFEEEIVKDVIKDVYEALFITEYDSGIYNTVIGQYSFNKRTKDIILKTASLLSNYANMDMI